MGSLSNDLYKRTKTKYTFLPITANAYFHLREVKQVNTHNNKINKEYENISKINKLDTSGSVILNFGKNSICNFSWGFNMPYENYLKIVGIKGSMYAKFIFSKKIVQGCEIKIFSNNKHKTIIINKANQINLAFDYFLNTKTNQKYNKISLKLLKILDLIKKVDY